MHECTGYLLARLVLGHNRAEETAISSALFLSV